ncbi:MAG: glycoside hydrolase family 3 protein [Campylobacterales bacterium]|nr:glycoside hydrolase family 3 protein [Campylobacterales bacterium]
MKFILLFLLLLDAHFLGADAISSKDENLKKMIGHMLIVGFDDEKIDENSKIVQQIQKYELGGVILFDRFYNDRNKTKNISSPEQLKELTTKLKSFAKKPLFISIDQEGGKVARLKPSYGFSEIPSAKNISEQGIPHAKETYEIMAKMIRENGINCNFAPVVDLALNPKNSVIVGLERSYGSTSEQVSNYAKILIEAQKKEGVVSVLKHFPGHGSSLGDSHQGFVDVTETWSKKELEPYQTLISFGHVEMIMTAHVFNSHLDEKYPATLSYNVNTKLLRQEMKYSGVIVSDDLQMKAISENFSLKETVTLAINAGVDMLLFGNQLGSQDLDALVETIYTQVKNGAIPHARILESNKRIELLQKKMSL